MPDFEVPIPLLRHTLATLAYRCGKTLRGAPAEFASFRAAPRTRTPLDILAHMGDLMNWALSLADGEHLWNDSVPLPWPEEIERFFRTVEALDRRLASGAPLRCTPEKLFQGAIADAFTHAGQIGMLRGISGSPVLGESYYRADIQAGRVGWDQAPPVLEFE